MAIYISKSGMPFSDTPGQVNILCMVLSYTGGLEQSPEWGNCQCAVCAGHRARLEAQACEKR